MDLDAPVLCFTDAVSGFDQRLSFTVGADFDRGARNPKIFDSATNRLDPALGKTLIIRRCTTAIGVTGQDHLRCTTSPILVDSPLQNVLTVAIDLAGIESEELELGPEFRNRL